MLPTTPPFTQTHVCSCPNGPLCPQLSKETAARAGAEEATQSVGSVPSLGDPVGHWKEAQLCFTELLAITMLVKRKASKVGQPGF